MEKGAFLLFREYGKEVQMLSDEEAGALFKAIYAYECGLEGPQLSGAAGLLFSIFRRKLDAEREKYRDKCQRLQANARRGGEASARARKKSGEGPAPSEEGGTKPDQMEANGSEMEANAAKPNQIERNTNPNTNTNPKEDPPLPPQRGEDTVFGERLQGVFEDWLRYKKERRQSYKPTSLQKLVARLKKSAAAFGEEAVADVIEESMACGYQGIMFDRIGGRSRDKPPGAYATGPDYGDKGEYL